MSPRGTSTSLSARTASPYSRRPGSQPKSSRQQFSACGACRMRRVRCDLKDLSASSNHSPCSNCKERGLNCVDEYAEIKAVKLLRRGRRLQQVEAIYGKIKSAENAVLSAQASTDIPTLKYEFFASKFWTWFCIQRPVLDPNEFSRRYLAHLEGRYPLGSEGMVLALLLVVWAASFGVDESGMPMDDDFDNSNPLHATEKASSPTISLDSTEVPCGPSNHVKSSQDDRKHRRQSITLMLQQILELIDSHSILRRPTVDGARILLLLVPLMEDASYLEKDAMYEAALSHTRILCNPRAGPWLSSQLPSTTGEESGALSRMFLYAQIQEGITTTLKGGHQAFRSEDSDILRRMVNSSSMSPLSPTSASEVAVGSHLMTLALLDKQLVQLTSMPLHLSSVCCKIHEALTGPKAARRAEEHGLVDANGMREIWQDLDQCWHGFDAMKNNTLPDFGRANLESFADAWLIFIFECHNIIQESLKRLALAAESSKHFSTYNGASRPTSHSSSSSPYLPPRQLYQEAKMRCVQLLPRVLRIIRYQLTSSAGAPNLFTWDTGFIRDGCRSAGLLAAELHGDFPCLDGHQVKPEETDDCITPEDGVSLCLSALAQMRWAFSNSEERSEAIRAALERSKEKYETQSPTHPHLLSNMFGSTNSHMEHNQCPPYSGDFLHPYSHCPDVTTRGRRAPLTVDIGLHALRQVESAPNTACSTDGSTGWPTYTPPATASTAPILSSRGSPVCHSPYQTGHDEAVFYYMPETLDHFTYNATAPHTTTSVVPDTIYQHRNAFYDTHDVHVAVETASDCLGSDFFTPDTSLLPIHEAKGYIDIPIHDTL